MSPDPDHVQAQHAAPPLLALHKVQSGLTFGATNYPPDRLRRLVTFLNSEGIPFRLSFDDGYQQLRDVLPDLLPLLQIPPIVFMPTYWIGRENEWDYSYFLKPVKHLLENDIAELAAIGIEFGSHGHSHRLLMDGDHQEVTEELRLSKRILEDITGQAVEAISYPFGRFDESLMVLSAAAGYTVGYTMSFPTVNDPPLATGRIPVYTFDSLAVVRRRLERGRGYDWEKLKVSVATSLSGGTILLNRLRGRRG